MAINIVSGSVVSSDAEAIVNTVNCVGVMGKGIALQFKMAFPENYRLYAAACKENAVRPGEMFVVELGTLQFPKYIINFPTKRHWKASSKIEDIQSGLIDLIAQVSLRKIKSIAVPALGCGNGGLDWSIVRPIIEKAFRPLDDVDVRLFPPHGAPSPSELRVATKKPRLTQARAGILALLRQYQVEGYKHTLLEMQKLAYFLQEAGVPLNLSFEKHKFGPYAENLNFVLQHLEGHYTRGYGDRSKAAEIELVPGVIPEITAVLRDDSEITAAISKVKHLIHGYETPYGMELLSTVHWVMRESKLAAVDPEFAVSAVHAWNVRKQKIFKADHIKLARERLIAEKWIN